MPDGDIFISPEFVHLLGAFGFISINDLFPIKFFFRLTYRFK